MSDLFAGIDGGQSSTVATIGDRSGRVLGRGVAGPADEVGQAADSTRLRDALAAALAAALESAGLPRDAEFAEIVAGISGYEGRVAGLAPNLPSRSVHLMHDAPVAHAGAFGGTGGAVVIAGTGSVAYVGDGAAAGATYGGWGYLFGDEGSAFWLAREAVAESMRGVDGTSAQDDARAQALLETFGCDSLRELARGFYGGAISRSALARYAQRTIDDPRWAPLVARGAAALAGLARAALDAHPSVPRRVAFAGGLFISPAYRSAVSQALAPMEPVIDIATARYEPAIGALLLAYARGGLGIREVKLA